MNDFEKLPRMVAIHDISGLGKCSLTVALPIVSASGVECCCIPTALLSTHTGCFNDWTFHDLSDDILPIAEHWSKLDDIKFDAIYSGYLASEKQEELIEKCIDYLKGKDTIVIVDPAMADNGKYYANFDNKMALCFRRLIAKADIITPNITEACFITDTEYIPAPHSDEFVSELMSKLSALGPKIVAITGVCPDNEHVGIVAKDNLTGKTAQFMNISRAGTFHGSGDVFASSFASLLTRGADVETALELAEAFVSDCVERTEKRNVPRHYGLDFESALPQYIKNVEERLNY